MEINNVNIERIVKQVLAEMRGPAASAPSAQSGTAGAAPKTAKAAVLTAKEKLEIREFPIPPIGDGEMLVKVEGCGVCGTDAHEYRNDPFGIIPLVLGHEGTGVVARLGAGVTQDSAGKPVKVGDRIVTCVVFGDDPAMTMYDMNRLNISDTQDVYGLLPLSKGPLNGWFAEYLVLKSGSTFFVVNDLSLDLRLLVEPAAVVVHAVERAKSTGILRFNSRVAVQGCGPIGLLLTAVVRTLGVEHIVCLDTDDKRLAFAKALGAETVVNVKAHANDESLVSAVKAANGGQLADFAFQCTGSPAAHATVWKLVRRGGGLCELGFFVNNGDATINPHFDICNKEITVVGSWVYTLRDYATTFDFLKRAVGIGLPIEKLVTHKFPLERIDDAFKANIAMSGLKVAVVNP